ncbi:TM2 domain-containing protein, partial [Klebsiella pneumoniae]|nr:TM2 domain-containing protein [Klebsiella pneumoniae]
TQFTGGNKNRISGALLAFFLGGFGAHKFYFWKIGQGLLYLIFCWTFIPSIIAFVEFIIYLCDTDENFARKYG